MEEDFGKTHSCFQKGQLKLSRKELQKQKVVVQLHFEEKFQVECRKKKHHIEYEVQNGKKKVM